MFEKDDKRQFLLGSLCGGVRYMYLFVLAVACLSSSFGQNILAPPPIDFSGLAPTYRTTGTNQPGQVPPPPIVPAEAQPLLQLGSVQMRPHLLYRFLYGDGIPVRPGEDAKTAINEIYPGILLGLGNH